MTKDYRRWQCLNCAFIYDEVIGSPEDGLAPGTRWEDIPDDWYCPTCGAEKIDFEMIEID
jgi:rubredoxin